MAACKAAAAASILYATIPDHDDAGDGLEDEDLAKRGDRLKLQYLTTHTRRYVDGAKLGKHGACHIFRHSMGTLMLAGGADIRHIQEILGHAETSTTAIYTRVSIRHLKQVHDATHPGAKGAPGSPAAAEARSELAEGNAAAEKALLPLLAAEVGDEDAGGVSGEDARLEDAQIRLDQ